MNSSKKPSPLSNPGRQYEEIGQFLARNQAEFAELLTFIDFAEDFTLGFIEVNFPPDQDLLIEALTRHEDCQGIQWVILEFADPNLRFLRDELVQELDKIQPEADKKRVVIIKGLAKSIGVFGEHPPVLVDLNFVRDAYKRTVPYPLLFILPDYAITRLAKFAPDFWAWTSGVFRFKTSPQMQEMAIERAFQPAESFPRIATPEQQERVELLERLLMDYQPTGEQATGENLQHYTEILEQLGKAYLTQRKPEKAREYLEAALKLALRLRSASTLCSTSTPSETEVSTPSEAEVSTPSEAEVLKPDDLGFQVRIFNQLGRSYQQQRQFDRAIEYYQQSLTLSQKVENRHSEATELLNLGTVYQDLRQFKQAESFYQDCLEIVQEFDDRYSQASTYHNLGMLAKDLREYEQARQYYHQSLDIYIEFSDRYSQANTYHNLGNVALELREYEIAKQYYQQALDIFIEFSDRYSQASTYHQLGMVAEELREYEQARQYYQQALDIKIEFSDRYSQARTYHQLGNVAQELREYEQALQYYQQALDIKIEFGDRYNQAKTYHDLGWVAQELREYEQARQYYQQALDIFIEFSDRYSQARTYGQLGLLAEAQENYAEARENLQTALDIFLEYQDDYLAGVTRENLERISQN
ncbi:MAG: tetratricopeptide repeat protein [Coleofasciculus sp. A1-SPW-01]|uniref:tetratricopeptide repeat protein n=1 Tax=Coleofasciculus sp. A1-SPW-01 TaxID=3070819 RepID=UPI0032F29D3E